MKKIILMMVGLLAAFTNASTDSPSISGVTILPSTKQTTPLSEDERNKRDILSFLQNKHFGKNFNDVKTLQNVGYSKDYKTHQEKIRPDYPIVVPNHNDLANIDHSKSFGTHDAYDNLNLDYSNEFGTENRLNIPNLNGVSIYQLQKEKIPNTESLLIGFGTNNGGRVPTIPKTYSNSNTFRTGNKILSVSEIIEQSRSNTYGVNRINNLGLNYGSEHNVPSDFERHFDMSNLARRPMGWIDSWTPPWSSFDSQPIRIEPGFRRSFRGYGFDEWGGQGFTR